MNEKRRVPASLGRLGSKPCLIMAALASTLVPAQLFAQAVSAPTREELRVDQTLVQPDAQPIRLVVDGNIERGPCPLADPALAGTNVTFSSVTFNNLTAVSPATLDSAWRDLAGREIPVAALCEVRDRAATILRRQGYLAAVQIPPQRIDKNGEVRMDVLIARLTEVQVRGDAGRSEALIAAHLAKLTDRQWFNVKEAERHLLLMSDLPGHTVRLTLKPADGAPGEVVGDVVVMRQPFEIAVGAQNLGSKPVGREGIFAQIVANGITGLGDRTAFSIFNTVDLEEQTVLQLSHEMALGTSGLRIGASGLYGRSEPGLAAANFKTETVIGRLELSYPIIRTQAFSLYTAGGFELIDQKVELGSIDVSKDKLRILYGRLTLDTIDNGSLRGAGGYSSSEPKFRFVASLEARHGIGGLGASNDCTPIANCLPPFTPISNLLADPSAFVLRAEAVAEYRPTPSVTFAIAPRAQYSDDVLLGYEQFSLGNYTIGRGLDPGTVLGDSGIGSSFEVRIGKLMPGSPDAVSLQPYAFFDAAWAWSNDGGLTSDPRKVFTAGGGVRALWGNRLDANAVIAVPLRRSGLQTRKGDVRFLFTFRAKLVLWDPS